MRLCWASGYMPTANGIFSVLGLKQQYRPYVFRLVSCSLKKLVFSVGVSDCESDCQTDVNMILCVSGAVQRGVWEEQGERLQRGVWYTRTAEGQENARPDQQCKNGLLSTPTIMSFPFYSSCKCLKFFQLWNIKRHTVVSRMTHKSTIKLVNTLYTLYFKISEEIQ